MAFLDDFFSQIFPTKHEQLISFGEEDVYILPKSSYLAFKYFP